MRFGSEPCPGCNSLETRVVWSLKSVLRIAASLALLPVYVLGGLAGDHRGPILPLGRRCLKCGRSFKGISVVEEAARIMGAR